MTIDDVDTQPAEVVEALSPEEQAYWDNKGDVPVEKPADTAPAAVAEDKVEAKAEKPELEEKEPEIEKLVKHGAFEEERQRRKKAEAATRELELRLARLEGQQETLKKAEQGRMSDDGNPHPEAEIDVEKNPIEAIKQLKADIVARKQFEAQQEQIKGIVSTGQQYCRKFAEVEPQFFGKEGQEGAYAFLRRSTAERMAERGMAANEIEQAVNLAEIRLINDSLAQGLDPARAMWHWAHVAGFSPQTAAPQAPAKDLPRGEDGKFKAAKTEAEKVVDIEKAQKASKSLGSVPAGGGDGPLSLEALADMDDEEFAEYTKGKKWHTLHRNGVI